MAQTLAGLTLADVDNDQADHGRWLIQGANGSGKTFLASTIAQLGRTLFIDTIGERGTKSFAGSPWAKNVQRVRPLSTSQFTDIFNKLASGDHPFDAVIVDSLTGVQRMNLRLVLGQPEGDVRKIDRNFEGGADLQSWGKAAAIMSDIVLFGYALADATAAKPMHVVMTCQTRIVEDEILQTVTRVPDLQPAARGVVLGAADFVLYAQTEDTETYDAEGSPERRHVVRFGNDDSYRTKARVPMDLHGKIPHILGRKTPPSLASLSRVLRVGGVASASAK